MQAIITKFHGPTNVRGSRYSATCERGRIIVSADHSLTSDENHLAACAALVAKFVKEDNCDGRYNTPPESNPWNKPRAFGTLPDGTGAHVYIG